MTRSEYLVEIFGSTLWRNISPILLKEGKQVKTINDALNFANRWCMYLYYDSSIHTIKNRSKEIRDFKCSKVCIGHPGCTKKTCYKHFPY